MNCSFCIYCSFVQSTKWLSLPALQNHTPFMYGIWVLLNICTTSGLLCHTENNISCNYISCFLMEGMGRVGWGYGESHRKYWSLPVSLICGRGKNGIRLGLYFKLKERWWLCGKSFVSGDEAQPKAHYSCRNIFSCHFVFCTLLGSTCSLLSSPCE